MVHYHKFRNYDPLKSDFDSNDGEIVVPTNLFQNTDGCYGPCHKAAGIVQLPEKYEAVAIHPAGPQRNVIAKRQMADGTAAIFWTEMRSEIAATEMHHVCYVEDIRCVEIAGNIVVIGTSGGLRHLVWDGRQYACVDLASAFPTIEFGLIKAGTLTCAETFVITGASDDIGTTGNGASRPHPSTETERMDYSETFKGIAMAYRDTVDEQVVSKGYFHQPFFIRYALRMTDGTHILPSAPLLMLPTVLPPCLALNTSRDTEGRCAITTDFSSVNYFELTYRMPEDLPPAIRTLVSAIDIFISPKIPTFDESRLDDGYITTFSKVVGARSTMNNRGTRILNRTTGPIFEGHYSEDNDNFTAHYLSEGALSRKAFMVRPNLNFHQQICATGDFYKIASISRSATDGFEKIGIATVDFAALEKCQRLRDLPLSHCQLLPTAIIAHDNALLVANGGMILPKPLPVMSFGPAHSTGDSTGHTIDITVFIRMEGDVRHTSTQCRSVATLSDSIPRYVFYPDRRAFLMTFSDGDCTYSLPLSPHTSLHGAFWTGGMDTDYLPAPTDGNFLPATDADEPPIDMGKRLLISDTGNVFAFDSACSCSFLQSSINALCRATKAPKSGVFGRHNLYAFTGEGIWMLEYSGGRVKSTQKISNLTCHGSLSVAETGQIVAFISGDKIYMVEGSEIMPLSYSLASLHPHLIKLPHSKELLASAGMAADECTAEEYLAGCGLLHAPETDSIVTFNPGKDYSLIYSIGKKSWAVCDLAISGKIKTPAGYLATGADRNTRSNILRFESETADKDTFLITRPIKLSTAMEPRAIRSIEILGNFRNGNVAVAAYGTDNLRHWHLIGSSEKHYIEVFSNSPYRMVRICVAARLSEGEYLYGVKISSDD